MPGAAGADLLIGRILGGAAGIAGDHRLDAAQLIESVAAETPITPDMEELEALHKFLVTNHLTTTESKGAMQELKAKWLAGKKAWYAELLHN